ncbi:MAG: CDP-alcohol phosphatidyltransferase family protein [Ruminococcaceae bacterium]|nr:CDP-alcohol phosphatidyltransferase family protein [Oscillospiraceae bacterium]
MVMQILNVQWKWNIPNALSVLRILLILPFMTLYLLGCDEWAFLVLLLSGVTDMLDGFIARKFNMITDCGKLLDPLSDKLTQISVVAALAYRYIELRPLALLCLIKEVCQAIGSVILLRRKSKVRGSRWFGKLSTIMFYICMLVIVLWRDVLSPTAKWILVGSASLCMLLAFVGYFRLYLQIRREEMREETPASTEIPEKG